MESWLMIDGKQRGQVRGAVYRGDGAEVVALVRAGHLLDDDDALQLIGDGLVAALAERIEGAAEFAADCAAKLRERSWVGDEELADQLEAMLGTRPTPMLRPLPVDLEQLADLLEGDPMAEGGRIDLRTGEIWPRPAIDYARDIGEEDEDGDDEERWLWVEYEGSHHGYRDMERFIGTRTDPDWADRLSIAIQGRGAFRRFKDVLSRRPEELDEWFAFSEERQRGRARAWLADAGYRVTPRPGRVDER
jgi:Uncharacterised protein family (UPF0158)